MAIGFGASILQNSQKLLQKAEQGIQQRAYELFVAIVKASPVDKGLLINNWFPEAGSNFSTETTADTDKSGQGSLTRIKQVVMSGRSNLRSEISYTLSNNLHYAYRAEMLGWPKPSWSGRVGPYRMVAKSLQTVAAGYK